MINFLTDQFSFSLMLDIDIDTLTRRWLFSSSLIEKRMNVEEWAITSHYVIISTLFQLWLNNYYDGNKSFFYFEEFL